MTLGHVFALQDSVGFSVTVVPQVGALDVINTLVSSLGLLAIGLLFFQIRHATRWNRLNSQHNFLNNAFSLTLLRELFKATTAAGVPVRGRTAALTDGEVTKILDADEAYATVITYLNEYENICGAVRANVADAEVAYGIHSARVIHDFRLYKPLINRLRVREEDPLIFIEFEKVHDQWAQRYAKELAQEQNAKALKGIQNRG